MTLKEIAAETGGVLRDADEDVTVTSVVIDSRAARAGALFVALPGEHADGHAFATDAVERGAVAVLAREAVDAPAVMVDDPAAALTAVARSVRERLRARVIAVTGSSGKTITKDLIAAACGTSLRTVASEASFNNELGVPLTILSADDATEVLVVEVGSRGVGHIASLMPLVRPDVAVVTNVGTAHVGMFGSVERTAVAKAELVSGLGPGGTAVLNADDPAVRSMTEAAPGPVIMVGRRAGADLRAEDVSLDAQARPSFTVAAGGARYPMGLRARGEHMVGNALAAIAAAMAVGVPVSDAIDGASGCEPSGWRMRVTDTAAGRRLINDAYNANPESVAAALKALAVMGRGRPTWAVLGEMAELGTTAIEHHDRVGRLAVRVGIGSLLTVGEAARAIHEGARLEGMFGGEARFASDIPAAEEILAAECPRDAVVLVKASRAAGLERLAAAIEVMP